MEIHLRQHEDGSFVLEVKHRTLKKEIDVTGMVRDIVVDKIRALQQKLELEEKYRNWIVESAQETNRSLSTVAVRYETVMRRLKETNEAISHLANEWRRGRAIDEPLQELENVRYRNEHFLENDSTLKKLPKG